MSNSRMDRLAWSLMLDETPMYRSREVDLYVSDARRALLNVARGSWCHWMYLACRGACEIDQRREIRLLTAREPLVTRKRVNCSYRDTKPPKPVRLFERHGFSVRAELGDNGRTIERGRIVIEFVLGGRTRFNSFERIFRASLVPFAMDATDRLIVVGQAMEPDREDLPHEATNYVAIPIGRTGL